MQIPWLFLAPLWKKPIQERPLQTVTFPHPPFEFIISSTTSAKLNTIVPISQRNGLYTVDSDFFV